MQVNLGGNSNSIAVVRSYKIRNRFNIDHLSRPNYGKNYLVETILDIKRRKFS